MPFAERMLPTPELLGQSQATPNATNNLPKNLFEWQEFEKNVKNVTKPEVTGNMKTFFMNNPLTCEKKEPQLQIASIFGKQRNKISSTNEPSVTKVVSIKPRFFDFSNIDS